MEQLTFRYALEQDCGLILRFIRELASYEKLSGEVVATPELLREWIFEKKKAEVIFACADGWSGRVWTGTIPASTSICPWARSPWTSGRCTA